MKPPAFQNVSLIMRFRFFITILLWPAFFALSLFAAPNPQPLPKIKVVGKGFETESGESYIPFAVTYFHPGTGWAPQVWKKFDPETTRADFLKMKALGVNCARVFLSFGSFYQEPGKLNEDGLAKFDAFLEIAESTGIYIHPTGPDHWEGLPQWAQGDRYADEKVLTALEQFWKLFATRYRDRNVIFAYDLLNEPEVRWESPAMLEKWRPWLGKKYPTIDLKLPQIPAPKDDPLNRELLDYQLFRESIADEWTERQAKAIKSADPRALVTVGFIQWSIPSLLPGIQHYSGFRPERQARFLGFLEIHFYPLAQGALEYRNSEEIQKNFCYLDTVLREVAHPGKPVVIAEFGWYGGGKPSFDNGKHPAASEKQQADWCRGVVERTAGIAQGW